MDLPLMPGCNELLHGDLLRKNFRKCHVLAGTGKDGGGRTLGFTNYPRVASQDKDTLQVKEGSSVCPKQPEPAHLALDRKVLRFRGYFREGVHESRAETSRPRKCVVYYFLEDDTMCVAEPRMQNAGMAQGMIVRRHQFPRPGGDGHYGYRDLAVGQYVDIYGKSFYLYGCDAFTRDFMAEQGIEMNPNEGDPPDAYASQRQREMGRSIPRREGVRAQDYKNDTGITGAAGGCTATRQEVAATTQFLQHDRKVLRFKCVWDDRDKLNGDHRLFHLYYFLADGSIEVTEIGPQNSGRDPFPSFVRRQRIIKQGQGEKFANPTLSLSFRKQEPEYWRASDLRIGERVTVFGRTFLLYDCDAFTREYLMENFGCTEKELAPIEVKVCKRPTPRPPTPPHNGFGDPDDSLGNCRRLAVKVRVKDITQFIDKSGCQLKFSMRLVTDEPTDQIRRFVVTYYLDDDTLSVFEPAVRNSGILGGKFLQRQRVKLGDTGEYARAQDFYVGARVVVNKHTFLVLSTDERSLNYMEQNPQSFPKSDVNTVIDKVRAMLLAQGTGLKEAFDKADKDGSGKLDFDEFVGVFKCLGLPVCEQEVLTLMRFFDRDGSGDISYSEFCSRIVPAGEAPREGQTWEEVWKEWAEKTAEAARGEEAERNRMRMINESRAALAMQRFVQQYDKRRVLFHQELRVACDRAADGRIDAAGFRSVVADKLQLGIPPNQLDALCEVLFPVALERVPFTELCRLLESTSNYPHTAKSIGRFRPRDKGFRDQ